MDSKLERLVRNSIKNVVLKRSASRRCGLVLVIETDDQMSPFTVVFGYDPDDKSWQGVKCFPTLTEAFNAFMSWKSEPLDDETAPN